MPQTNILKVNDKIFNELFCDGIGEYVTIVFCGKNCLYVLSGHCKQPVSLTACAVISLSTVSRIKSER